MRLVAIVAALIPSVAHAGGPIVAEGGIGFGVGGLRSFSFQVDGERQFRPGTVVNAEVGFRVHHAAAVGVHLAVGSFFGYTTYDSHATLVPIQLGVSGQVMAGDRVWFLPFVGIDDGKLGDDLEGYRGLAFGLSVGVDVIHDQEQRWGPVVSFSGAHESGYGTTQGFITALAGVGYRYW
jgi:hypothetical protein